MSHSTTDLVIELLNKNHNRSSFHCGIESLDNYIKKQAKQDVKRRISQVFIATDLMNPEIIVGFYTLSSLSISLKDMPTKLSKKLPRHPIPAALIGRLAVRQNKQGTGIGRMLLTDAVKRTLKVSSDIAIYALVVDAINVQAELFYKQYGFTRLSINSSRLFLPLQNI